MDDVLIEAILKIGNHPQFMKMIEPQVMQPLQLQRWMVTRTLVALGLLGWENKNDIQCRAQSSDRQPNPE